MTLPLKTAHGLYVPKTEPFDHQAEAFNRSVDARYFALLMEQRTGKSKVEIDKAAHRFETTQITAWLIVAMPGLAHVNWVEDEIPAHLPDRIPRMCVAWDAAKASTKKYQEKLEDLLRFKGLAVLSVNGEAVITETFRRYLARFLKARGKVQATADETTLIMKTPGTARTKAMHAIGRDRAVVFRSMLDGTPFGESPMDWFAQVQFLHPGLLGHTSFYAYKNYYAEWETKRVYDPKTKSTREYNGIKELEDGSKAYRNLDELANRIATFSYRVLRKDCFDLPEKVYARRRFGLSKEQRRVYDSLASDYQAEFRNGLVANVTNVLTRYLRLQQVTSNYWPAIEALKICPACEGDGCEACDGLGALEVTVPSQRIDPDHHPRLEALRTQLEIRPDDRNIVWCKFHQDTDDVMEMLRALGRNPVQFDGRIDRKGKLAARDAFREKEATDLVGSQRAGGRALKLPADAMHYYSNEFPLIARLQSEDRTEFVGMEHGTGVYDYEAVDTVDEDIVAALVGKMSVADYVMREKKGTWL